VLRSLIQISLLNAKGHTEWSGVFWGLSRNETLE
jgi:hypothetical protein